MGYLTQSPAQAGSSQSSWHRIMFGQFLNIPSEGDSTFPLDNLSQCSSLPTEGVVPHVQVYLPVGHFLFIASFYYLVPPGRAWPHPPDTLLLDTYIYLCLYTLKSHFIWGHKDPQFVLPLNQLAKTLRALSAPEKNPGLLNGCLSRIPVTT